MPLDQTELNMIRKSARQIADQFGPEYWREHDKKKQYPWDFVKAFAGPHLEATRAWLRAYCVGVEFSQATDDPPVSDS